MRDGWIHNKFNKRQIKQHLKSAISDITPDVLDNIDLKQSQEPAVLISSSSAGYGRMRRMGNVIAACFGMIILSGGIYTYGSAKIDSRIEIDVNPSIELSVNRSNKVLEVEALNTDAVEIMDDMELKGVDLKIAVNAIIGSMAKHGYLDEVGNAILVTVSNDSVKKASDLRQIVVGDIESSLQENKIQAVVYDQQAIPLDEVQQLAGEYDISYGKAYFLHELIGQSETLTIEDMQELSSLTMQEIAKEMTKEPEIPGDIHESELEETIAQLAKTESESIAVVEESVAETAITETTAAESTAIAGVPAPPHSQESTLTLAQLPSETNGELVIDGKVKIECADYESGIVTVNFSSRVKWKNPTVSVSDEDGAMYPAMMGNPESTSCEIYVSDLGQGRTYTFVLGGIYQSGTNKATTVEGTFEVPVTADVSTEAPAAPTVTQPEESVPLKPIPPNSKPIESIAGEKSREG